ncbi:hypothetical protein CEXT_134871 [Caerostris extrusa]|uniref:Uncharacterized protein n=1 Tax=Caerostris extrusa TaxID=172846 RepID=A0AAV4PZH9_CAEEX|nr:hypothetical protein CEXT_134871 [Caerostris extrusa]
MQDKSLRYGVSASQQELFRKEHFLSSYSVPDLRQERSDILSDWRKALKSSLEYSNKTEILLLSALRSCEKEAYGQKSSNKSSNSLAR